MRLTIEWSRVRILLRPFGHFGNFLYPTFPVSFGRDTKSRWSLLSGVYARGSKRSHQSALEMCTVVDSTTHSNPPPTCNKPHTLRDAVTGRNKNRNRNRNMMLKMNNIAQFSSSWILFRQSVFSSQRIQYVFIHFESIGISV